MAEEEVWLSSGRTRCVSNSRVTTNYILMWLSWILCRYEEQWHFTGFYGEPRRENRWRSWALLQHLKQLSGSPWLCAGDFNEILEATEQFGGVTRPEGQMDGFREAVSTCGFTDLGFIGLPYTWDNRQHGSRNVKARLDRALADADFFILFQRCYGLACANDGI